MRRRDLLTSAGTVTPLLTGCLGLSLRDETTPDADGTATGTGTDDGHWRNRNGVHDLVLANYDDDTRALSVLVESNGETVIDGTYELPDGRGGVFEDVAGWEERYEISAELGTGESETFVWKTASCTHVDENPNGSRDGWVGIRSPHGDGELSHYRDGCDAIYGGVPTGPASLFVVDEEGDG